MNQLQSIFQYLKQYEINLEDYECIGLIYEGEYGYIYTIKKKNSPKEIYIAKVLKEKSFSDITKMNREIGILIKSQHATIIKFYGYSLRSFDNEKDITIIMEYAQNGSLFDFLNHRKFPKKYEDTIKQIIITGISRGMMILHELDLLHRDLKPENILLDDNLYPLISDFSLSKQLKMEDSWDQSTNETTPLYMAPEMYKGNHYNRKVDVYAFGIIMYQVLTGLTPFKNAPVGYNDFGEYINQGFRPEFDQNNPLKKSLQNLIEKCWDNDPNKRPTFSEIYKKLSFNCEEDSVGDFNEYYLENVDVDKFVDYLKLIDDDFKNFLGQNEIQKYSLFKKTSNKLKAVKNEKTENNKKINQILVNEMSNINNQLNNMMKKDDEMIDEIKKLKAEKKEMQGKISSLLEKISELTNEKTISNEEENNQINVSLNCLGSLIDTTSVYKPKKH